MTLPSPGPGRPAAALSGGSGPSTVRLLQQDHPRDRQPSRDRHERALIRELEDEDIPGLARLVRPLVPTQVLSEHTLDHMRTCTTWWVAVDEGEVVGAARAGRFGRCWVGVAPEARSRGLGSQLARLVEQAVAEAGHAEAVAWSDGGDAAAFAARRGYVTVRRKPVSVLRLDGRPAEPVVAPPGVSILPLVEIDDRLRELHALTMAAYADVPDGARDACQSFEEWLRDDLGTPELDYNGSVVAVVGGLLAALALVTIDGGGRAENEFTGTHPDFRGRGLATLVKRAAIAWCRSHHVRELWTGNDSENAPMLAVNRKLGYEPSHVRYMHVKRLG